LILRPEQIRELMVQPLETDVTALKKQVVENEREEKALKEKQNRLLDLYLQGNLPQASYVVKSSQMEAEAERLEQTYAGLHQKIQSHGKAAVTDDLVQILRVLARSHRRFSEEQKTKVFRSVVKEARLTAAGVELELYVQPTQNVWWKYRQKTNSKHVQSPVNTGCARERDQTEVGTGDVHRRVGEIRMVEDVDRVQPNLELLGLGDSNAFEQVRAQTDLARTFDPVR
jgi:hypothetical protein